MRFAIVRLIWIEAIRIALANTSFSWTKTQKVTSRWTIHTLMETINKFSTVSSTMVSSRIRKVESYCLSSQMVKIWLKGALKLIGALPVLLTMLVTMFLRRVWAIWAPPENNQIAFTHQNLRAAALARKRTDLGGMALDKLKKWRRRSRRKSLTPSIKTHVAVKAVSFFDGQWK